MRRGRGFRRSSGVTQPEAPLRLTGMKAWLDGRLLSGTISSWASRAGSLGAVAFTQSTAGNKPVTATGISSLNGQQAASFDGTDDQLVADNTNAWKFLHDGSGCSIFVVRNINSATLTRYLLCSVDNDPTKVGIALEYPATNANLRVFDGGGSGALNNFTPTGGGTRQAGAWECWSHVTGTLTYARSGSVQTQADTGGHTPSSSNPTTALCISGTPAGPTNNPFVGYVAQIIFYDHVLSSTERGLLATWANSIYGVAV